MSNQIMLSVKELRAIKTPKSNEATSYRDLQRLPVRKSNFKRVYLQGASNRVKSLKEETQFADLYRKGNEKLYKFNRQDQLLNVRNFHLHKLVPLNTDPQLDESQNQLRSQVTSPMETSNLRLVKDPQNQILELVYNPEPVVRKLFQSPYKQTELRQLKVSHNNLASPIEVKRKYDIFKAPTKKSLNDLFVDSIQTTSYGSLRIETQDTKQNTLSKLNVPSSLEKTKKYLKQYL